LPANRLIKSTDPFAEQVRDVGAGVRDFATVWNALFGTKE
jgi:hypothetical protein